MNGTSDYTTQVSPRQIMEQVQRGYKRMDLFRRARILFLRNYTGQYYDRQRGDIGNEPLNLVFNAIRVLVPNLVMNFAKHNIETPYIQAKQYSELLGMALDQNDKALHIPDKYRRCIVDAIFTLGIMKTGLAGSDSVYVLDQDFQIDAGTVYTECVDFDNFVVDPYSTEHMFEDARFVGDRMCIPRRTLLESGLYNSDLVMRMPRAGEDADKKASALSMKNINPRENYDLEDEVEIVELWVPSANAVITVPASDDVTFDDFLRVDDYYGVKEGPYTLLALTPPVPGNPLPVPMVGIWNDLHVKANEMATKTIEQAVTQKDILGYKGSAADDAEEIRQARNGDAVKMDDPQAIAMYSFGGQKSSNEQMLVQLQGWFNQMAGNPAQMGGQSQDSNSATGTMILQQNASVSLNDMKDMVYKTAAAEARRRAWYFHTDPLMQVPLTKRQVQPAQFAPGPNGQIVIVPPTIDQVQIVLTPDARSGEFFDFTFTIEPESMGRVDSQTRLQQMLDFCTKILPGVLTAAQTAMQMGLALSPKALLERAAKDMHIEWLDEVFYDPEFQQQLMMQMMMGPQPGPSKGQAAPAGPGNGSMAAMQQNGQPANVGASAPTPQQQVNSQQQQGAQLGQRILQREVTHNLFSTSQPSYGG